MKLYSTIQAVYWNYGLAQCVLWLLCRKHWLLVREKSTFVDWQRVKVQELSEEVRREQK